MAGPRRSAMTRCSMSRFAYLGASAKSASSVSQLLSIPPHPQLVSSNERERSRRVTTTATAGTRSQRIARNHTDKQKARWLEKADETPAEPRTTAAITTASRTTSTRTKGTRWLNVARSAMWRYTTVRCSERKRSWMGACCAPSICSAPGPQSASGRMQKAHRSVADLWCHIAAESTYSAF